MLITMRDYGIPKLPLGTRSISSSAIPEDRNHCGLENTVIVRQCTPENSASKPSKDRLGSRCTYTEHNNSTGDNSLVTPPVLNLRLYNLNVVYSTAVT